MDETVTNLRAELPGANYGACGFAGCDDYAAALAEDPTIGTAKMSCRRSGCSCQTFADILGVEAGSAEPQVAVVMCNGNAQAAKKLMEYQGLSTCAAAKQLFGGLNMCPRMSGSWRLSGCVPLWRYPGMRRRSCSKQRYVRGMWYMRLTLVLTTLSE